MNDIGTCNEALQGMAQQYDVLVRGLGLLQDLDALADQGTCGRAALREVNKLLASHRLADNYSIMLANQVQSRLQVEAAGSAAEGAGTILDKTIWGGEGFARGEGIAGRVFQAGHAIRLGDAQNEPEFSARPGMGVELRSLLCVPLERQGERIGVLNLSSKERDAFSEDHERLMLMAARRIASLLMQRGGGPGEGDGREKPNGKVMTELAEVISSDLCRILGRAVSRLEDHQRAGSSESLREARDAVKEAVKVAGNVSRLINPPSLRRAELDLEGLLEDVVENWRRALRQGFELQLVLPRPLPRVVADIDQVREALNQMIANARDAVVARPEKDRGPGHIIVGAESARCTEAGTMGEGAAPGLYARLYVRDNGVGVTPKVAARVFEPFYTTKSLEGAGMGLALVRQTAVVHQGWARFEPREGEGCEVSLFLPGDASETGEEGPPKTRVLLVDDEVMVRSLGMAILRRLGYEAAIADGGADALRQFQEAPDSFDLIILDLSMPDISGQEVLRRVRTLRPEQRVIISSGLGSLEEMSFSTPYKPDGFVSKPYLIVTLQDEIARVLRLQKGR